ncbi:unnamed protein product [Phytophthora fragariaefolia]|uniref:Unnamed protein product n=1 Tax=Phytophthora fragariaefolia TaxID=1490495 RepID=A0A9W6Y7L9_9STRA|nr:unnamed protein product [Phytophthora fragariaefolia]
MMNSEDSQLSREIEAWLGRPPLRQKFAAVDDIVLLKAVNTFRPWTAAVGTSKGIMKVFEDIAIHCQLDESFGLKKPGTAMRTRFTNLVNQYKTDQCQSMRKSGTVEEYAEREILLENIVTLMNDWDDKEAQRKKEQTVKQKGIESSGELLRRLAKGEIVSEEDDNRSEGDISERTTDEMAEAAERATASDSVDLFTPNRRTTRGSSGVNSGRKKKITKRERLDVVANGITSALLEVNDGDKAKYTYKMERLQFEREQEEKKRVHATEEAEKRRAHELQLEDRRLQADEAHDKRMQDFILRILEQQKQ